MREDRAGDRPEDESEDGIEFMELGEEEESAPDGSREAWEEGDPPLPPWKMALLFLGLIAAAALICAILWRVSHGGGGQGAGPGEAPGEAASPQVSASEELLLPSESPAPLSEEQTIPSPPPEQEASQEPQETEPPAETSAPPSETQNPAVSTGGDNTQGFAAVQESVTPKDVVNLRSEPSTADDATIVVQVSNGEVLSRTGRNDNTGWSQIDYNGQTLYAVSQYLTTDLSYKPPIQPADPNRVTTVSGRVILFTDCDDQLTPKEYVNLRTEPSTTEGDATVRCQVSSGQTVHRTGYSPDSGWSRVEYNGEALYVVTSLMTQVTQAE